VAVTWFTACLPADLPGWVHPVIKVFGFGTLPSGALPFAAAGRWPGWSSAVLRAGRRSLRRK